MVLLSLSVATAWVVKCDVVGPGTQSALSGVAYVLFAVAVLWDLAGLPRTAPRTLPLWGGLLGFLFLVHRTANVPLLVVVAVQVVLFTEVAFHGCGRSPGRQARNVLAADCLARASYYMFGTANAISSVDFAGAYTGFSGFSKYQIAAVIFLLVYSGPLLWTSWRVAALARGIYSPASLVAPSLAHRAVLLSSAAAMCALQRHHLFAWSVFTPKVLFETGWLLFDLLQAGITLFPLLYTTRRN
mmetsp:Transcript_16068/g.45462  ORF Transcript_16068/g.45462 Transcript_16068/m.45462 type:complete len:243 (+) Transcript_16068:414-1142(+)